MGLFRTLKARFRVRRAKREIITRRISSHPHGLDARLIVSLTSYPKRFATLPWTLTCLLRQSIQPDAVILWVSDSDFDLLPASVTDLKKEGLEVRRTADIRSYMKIIPVLRDMPDAYIATADDDLYYPADWLQGLVDTVKAHPKRIAAQRAHRIQYKSDRQMASYTHWQKNISGAVEGVDIFATGAGGVLYPPNSLHPDVLCEDAFLTLCPHADDIWLYWMAKRQGSIVRHVGPSRRILEWPGSQTTNLRSTNLGAPGVNGNDIAIAALSKRFGQPTS